MLPDSVFFYDSTPAALTLTLKATLGLHHCTAFLFDKRINVTLLIFLQEKTKLGLNDTSDVCLWRNIQTPRVISLSVPLIKTQLSTSDSDQHIVIHSQLLASGFQTPR